MMAARRSRRMTSSGGTPGTGGRGTSRTTPGRTRRMGSPTPGRPCRAGCGRATPWGTPGGPGPSRWLPPTCLTTPRPVRRRGWRGRPVRPLIVDWDWDLVTDDGGATVESYDLQWRYSGNGWAGNTIRVTGTHASHGVLNANTDVQARVLARNSEGTSGYSSTVTVDAADLLEEEPMSVEYLLYENAAGLDIATGRSRSTT